MLRSDFFACSLIPGASSSGGRKLICSLSPLGRAFSFAGEAWYTRFVGDDPGEARDRASSLEARLLGVVGSRTLFLALTMTFSGFVGVDETDEDGGSSLTGESLDLEGAAKAMVNSSCARCFQETKERKSKGHRGGRVC